MKNGIDFSGFEKFTKDFNKAKKKAEHISFEELFNNKFMRKYTNFSTFDNLLEKSGFKVESEDDFKAIPDIEFDNFIISCTKFNTWEEMLNKAYEEYLVKNFQF